MKRYLYREAEENWQYFPPFLKLTIFLEIYKEKIFYWFPRVFGIFLIVFLSIFALDSFTGHSPILFKIVVFIIHLIPSYILAIILWIAWKKEILGGVLFIILALTIFYAFKEILFSPLLFVAGILFLFERLNKIHFQRR